jgi:hypothetical protein
MDTRVKPAYDTFLVHRHSGMRLRARALGGKIDVVNFAQSSRPGMTDYLISLKRAA